MGGGGGGGGGWWMDIVFVDLFSTQNSFYGKCCQRDSCEPCDGNRICDIFCVGQTSFGSTSHQFGSNCKALWSWNVNCSCSGNSCILRAEEFTDFVLTDLCANHARCSGHFPWNVSLIVRRNGRKSSAFSVQGNEWSAELTGNTWHVRWKAGKRKETNVTISLWNVMLPQYTHHVSHRCREMFWSTFLEDTPNSSAPNGTIGFPEAVKRTIGEVRETPFKIVLHLQLCPLPTPQSPWKIYSCRVSHSSAGCVRPLTPLDLIFEEAALTRTIALEDVSLRFWDWTHRQSWVITDYM